MDNEQSFDLSMFALASFEADPDREYTLAELPPPFYHPVEAPRCGHLLLIPRVGQETDGLPPEVRCDAPQGHDGQHRIVWDAWEGSAMGWPESVPDAQVSSYQADKLREIGQWSP